MHRKDDSDEEPGKEKWHTLEHHGVSFFPGYEPHGVKLLFKGRPIDLKPEVEEICNWWAVEEGSDFAKKETVKENFVSSFLSLFPKELGASCIEDFDFSLIKAHLVK